MKVPRNKKGFTLVEVIVSLLVVSIILAFATSFFFVGEKLFSNSTKGNTRKMVGDNVLNFVSDRLKYSSKLEIRNNSSMTDAKYSNNILWLNSNKKLCFKTSGTDLGDIFGDSFYNQNSISVTVQVLPNYNLKVEVKVLDIDNKEVYSTSSVIKLMNMDNTKTTVEIVGSSAGNNIVNPVISYENPDTKVT